MFLKPEDLDAYSDIPMGAHACEEGHRWMHEHYPDGAELATIIQDPSIPIDMLHWGMEWLPASKEEKDLYRSRVNIDTSSYCYNSHDVFQSRFVEGCSDVDDSKSIKDSHHIFDSSHVVGSTRVRTSTNIIDSADVTYSENVRAAHNVSLSTGVDSCKTVIRSVCVFDSNNLKECSFVVKSENLFNAYFCAQCKNLSNALFCFGLTDADPDKCYIFNKPVDAEIFAMCCEALSYFEGHLGEFGTITLGLNGNINHININRNPFKRFANLQSDFIDWVKGLPFTII